MKQTFASAMVLLTVIFMDLLGGMELDLLVPSFPELKNHFGLSAFWVETLLSINFAGFCLSLFFVGGLADRYGRKPIILLGIAIFIIGSMLCLWEASFKFLIAGRFLQGIGVAAPATLCLLIIADSYPLKKQQYLMAMMNGITNASVAAAPVLGSYITMYFHWQGNFVTLLLLGITVAVMTIIFIPAHKPSEDKEPISLLGYVPLFQSKPLMLLITHIVFVFTPYWIFVGMSPLLYMEDLGVSLSHFGYYQGVLALTFAIGSVCAGLIINKYDQKKMMYISAQVYIVGLIGIALVTFVGSTDPLIITLTFLLYNMATTIPSMILYPLCLNFMPQAKGRVSALIQGGRLVLTALCLELAGYFYTGSFRNIGIIIIGLSAFVITTLFFVIKNHEIMKFSEK